jgi:zinc protease
LAAEIINYTLGGSAFTSRLYHEIREKRGLAYSIGTALDRYSFMAELSGSFGSAPGSVEEAIWLMRRELQGLADDPPTDAEVEEAKVALAGDYLRGLIRQADLANELTLRMEQGEGPSFVDDYAGRLAAISPNEVRQLAGRIDWLRRLVVVTVGAPKGGADANLDRSRLHSSPPKEP